MAVGMGIFLATIDGSIINIALPTLVAELHTEFAIVQWVILAYLLTIISLMLGVGSFSDIFGKKKIYTAGFIVFTLGSALCGLATSIQALIGFRIVQALGASMVFALGMAIAIEAFPEKERGFAIGMTGAIVSVGLAIGPTIGGLILQNLTWNWIFWVNLPVGIIGTFMVIRYVPLTKTQKSQKFDFLGAITLSAALLAFMISLTLGQINGFGSASVFVLAGLFVIFFIGFLLIEIKVERPVIGLDLFKIRYFSVSILTGFISFLCLAGTVLLVPFYAENILNFDPQRTGLLMVTLPVALGIMSPLSGVLSDRFGSRLISIIGLGIMALGFLSLSSLNNETSVPGFIVRSLLLGVGIGIFQSANYSAIMGSGPRQRLGAISGLVSVMRSLGQATGIAVIGALWAGRVYFHAGGIQAGGATHASVMAQLLGLQETFLYISFFCFAAMLISIWGAASKKIQSIQA
jgi:EmrB/QacA subfamily drug resistance transporter